MIFGSHVFLAPTTTTNWEADEEDGGIAQRFAIGS
jgi:hypothetical protein